MRNLEVAVLTLGLGPGCMPSGARECDPNEHKLIEHALHVLDAYPSRHVPDLNYEPKIYCGDKEESTGLDGDLSASTHFQPGKDSIVLDDHALEPLLPLYVKYGLLDLDVELAHALYACREQLSLALGESAYGEHGLNILDVNQLASVLRHELHHIWIQKDHSDELKAALAKSASCKNEEACAQSYSEFQRLMDKDPIYKADEAYAEFLDQAFPSIYNHNYLGRLWDRPAYFDCYYANEADPNRNQNCAFPVYEVCVANASNSIL